MPCGGLSTANLRAVRPLSRSERQRLELVLREPRPQVPAARPQALRARASRRGRDARARRTRRPPSRTRTPSWPCEPRARPWPPRAPSPGARSCPECYGVCSAMRARRSATRWRTARWLGWSPMLQPWPIAKAYSHEASSVRSSSRRASRSGFTRSESASERLDLTVRPRPDVALPPEGGSSARDQRDLPEQPGGHRGADRERRGQPAEDALRRRGLGGLARGGLGLVERAVEQPLGPGELEREHGEADRDDDERGAGRDEHCQADERHGGAGEREADPVHAAAPLVRLAAHGEPLLHALGARGLAAALVGRARHVAARPRRGLIGPAQVTPPR